MNENDSALIAPSIYTPALPSEEREAADAINLNLSALSSVVNDFAAILHLMDHIEVLDAATPKKQENMPKLMEYARWTAIAARQGAIAVYEYYQLSQAICYLLKKCPTVESYIDFKTLSKSKGRFEDKFSGFATIRHFAAHGSETLSTPDKRKDESIANGLNLLNNLHGRTLSSAGKPSDKSKQARLVSLDLTPEKLEALTDICLLHFAGFKEVEKASIACASLQNPKTLEPRG